MNLAELLSPFVTDVLSENTDIAGLHNDSRQIKPNFLFVAYPGSQADGRLYISQAIQAGASAVVYEPESLPAKFTPPESIPCIPISDLGNKLAAIAAQFYGHPAQALDITGITGTNGKTTIAYLLAQAYELLQQKSAYIGTLGQGSIDALKPLTNTTPDGLCLQKLLHDYQQQTVQFVCMEVSSHALSQKRVDQISFTQAIFSNLSHEHLDYHHTMAAYAAAKALLFATPTLKTAILNHDDEYTYLMQAELSPNCKALTYGLQPGCDVRAINLKSDMTGSEFDVLSPWGRHHFCIKTLGLFNLYNSLAVLTSLLAKGYTPETLIPVLAKLQASPGRMEVVMSKPCVIVDYAHTPDALQNVLSSLQKLKKARIGVVFGCGGERDKAKRPMMGRVVSDYADFAIITSDNPRREDPEQIINDIAQGMQKIDHVEKIVDRKQAIQKALSLANKDDILVIAGKGHEPYQQIGTTFFDFSDQDVVRKRMP